MAEDSKISDEDLSGPVVDRRTTISLLSAAGLSALAGCTGGGGGGGGNGGSGDENGGSGNGSSGSGNGGTNSSGGSGGTDTAKNGSSGDVHTGGRLQAGWFTGSIDVLDPPYIDVGQYFQVAGNVFSGLVTLKKDLTVQGDLAKDWTVSNGGKTYTFELRKGVTFHDGSKFTADDVKYTINRTIEKETPAADKLSTLKPVDEGGVVVKDPHTVKIQFKQPMAPALIYLTRGPGRAATIVSKDAIQKMGEKKYKVTPVGTGPFEVAEHQVGSHITLDAYEDYFGTDEKGNQLPYLDGVDIKPIPDPSTMVNALSSGDIDFANLLPLQNVSNVESASGVAVDSAPGVNWYGLAMNEKRKPFDDPKARMGIAKSIDNDQFVQSAYFGNALAAKGPINKATAWVYRENKPNDQAYDPKKAKKLLKESGAEGASFELLTTKSSLRSAKVMRQQLNKAGFDVSLDQVTSSTYWDKYEKLNYDATVSGSVGDPDPDQSLWNFYRKDGPWNWTNYKSDTVHELLGKQRTELDRKQRAKTLQKLEDQLIADAPSAYLVHEDDLTGVGDSVQGFAHIPFMRNFHTVWLEQ